MHSVTLSIVAKFLSRNEVGIAFCLQRIVVYMLHLSSCDSYFMSGTWRSVSVWCEANVFASVPAFGKRAVYKCIYETYWLNPTECASTNRPCLEHYLCECSIGVVRSVSQVVDVCRIYFTRLLHWKAPLAFPFPPICVCILLHKPAKERIRSLYCYTTLI